MRLTTLIVGILMSVSTLSAAEETDTKVNVGSLVITDHYIRATPPKAKVAAGYLTIENTGSNSETLLGGEVEFARKVEVHEMKMTDGVMKMRPLRNGITIQPGEIVTLKSGADHLMFMQINEPMVEGDVHEIKLLFEEAGEVEILFRVGSRSSRDSHSGHNH